LDPPQDDVRGFKAWGVANPVVGTDNDAEDMSIGSVSGTFTNLVIQHTTSGTALLDKTSYTFYLSCYDWFGNQDLTDLPSITATTRVQLKTDPGKSRIEIDDDGNCIRIVCDLLKVNSD